MNRFLLRLALLLFPAFAPAAEPSTAAPQVSIEWDRASARAVFPGGYGRARKLRNGELMLVYSHGTAALASTSRDLGVTWQPPRNVAEHDGWFDTNSELIELDNGWLVYGLNSRPTRANEGRLSYVIRTLISRDGGRTWGDERDVFTGGYAFVLCHAEGRRSISAVGRVTNSRDPSHLLRMTSRRRGYRTVYLL